MGLFDGFFTSAKPKKAGSNVGRLFSLENKPQVQAASPSDSFVASEGASKLPDWMSNYGVEKPKFEYKHGKGNLFDKILVAGLSGLDAMRNNRGLIPGALAGYAGIRGGEIGAEQDAEVAAQKNFENERNFRQKSDLGIRNADALDSYRKGSLGIAQQNANTAANKAPALSDTARLTKAMTNIAQAQAEGRVADDDDLATVEAINKIKGIQ